VIPFLVCRCMVFHSWPGKFETHWLNEAMSTSVFTYFLLNCNVLSFFITVPRVVTFLFGLGLKWIGLWSRVVCRCLSSRKPGLGPSGGIGWAKTVSQRNLHK